MAEQSDFFFWDGYLHWANILDDKFKKGPFGTRAYTAPVNKRRAKSKASSSETRYEPIFIRIKDLLSEDARDALVEMFVSEERDFVKICETSGLQFLIELGEMDQEDDPELIFEADEIMTGLDSAIKCNRPVEFFIYRKTTEIKTEHGKYERLYEVIDVGPPAFARGVEPKVSVFGPPEKEFATVGAVIDNDIGFLNEAFCYDSSKSKKKTTRFFKIWLQARDQAKVTQSGPLTTIGRRIEQSEINDMLEKFHANERAAYAQINDELHAWELFRTAPLSDTHGTSVAALAFGNDPYADPEAAKIDIPLMAVQVPPEAAADTSGAYSESYIVQGVRWLCREARQFGSEVKLIINISYGVLAGPKNGSKFIEQQIKREIECAAKLGVTAKVVFAFGNSRNTKQLAEIKVLGEDTIKAPAWVIPNNQRLPSHMEIRAVSADRMQLERVPDDISFCLTSPSGEKLEYDPASHGEVFPAIVEEKHAVSARFFNVPDRSFLDPTRKDSTGMIQIAIAPTIPLVDLNAIADNGDWQLEVRNASKTDVTLVLQIQRGDIAPGFSVGGRQSHFEGHYTTDHSGPFPVRDVVEHLTNAGTNSAYTTAQHSQIFTVGADQTILGERRRADYTGQGADWTPSKDAKSYEVVDGMFRTGKRVTGTYSGTITRLSGTSAAAALFSRSLL